MLVCRWGPQDKEFSKLKKALIAAVRLGRSMFSYGERTRCQRVI